jgi:hypothetical protein
MLLLGFLYTTSGGLAVAALYQLLKVGGIITLGR